MQKTRPRGGRTVDFPLRVLVSSDMVGAIIGAAYCFHKAFDRRGYARNTNFDTRVGWLTGAVGIAYGLFVFLKWEWWEQLGLAIGVMLCLTAILGILMGGKS